MQKSSSGFLGSLSGIIIAAFLQPLENIKMALIFSPPDLVKSHNLITDIFNAGKYIANSQGIRGFYKGNIPNMIRAGVGNYFYFTTLRILQNIYKSDSSLQNFVCSSLSRILGSVFTNPINVVQTRFQLLNFKGYNSIFDAVIQIYKHEGINTFFKGGLATMCKEGTFAGFYYMLYQQIKYFGFSKFLAGMISGLISTALSHPFDIVRAKLQTEGIRENGNGVKTSLSLQIKGFIKYGGWFRGLSPRLLKKPISNCLVFILFENFQQRKNYDQ